MADEADGVGDAGGAGAGDGATEAGVLRKVHSGSLQLNGVTTAGERLFAVSQGDTDPDAAGPPPQLVEIVDGRPVAFPDAAWNSWRAGHPVEGRFIGINSTRVGPDGTLWAVDRGAPGIGQPRVDGAPRLIGFDVATGGIARVYELQDATRPWSFVDDVRFHGGHAYLTDAAAPAIIVLDLESGVARRVLEGHPATIAQHPLVAEHRALATPDAAPVTIHVDQLEVSPDGEWLYFQPCCGGMSRIRTALLDDPSLGETALAEGVESFAATPSTGGTAIADDGTIYVSDVDRSRILAVSPSGDIATVLQDARLAWVDAMWIADDGELMMPSAQLNRTADLNWGIDVVVPPCTVFGWQTGKGPFRS